MFLKRNDTKLLIIKNIIFILLIFCVNVRAINLLPREFQHINTDNFGKQLYSNGFNYGRQTNQHAVLGTLFHQQQQDEQRQQLADISRAIRRPFRNNEMMVARGFGKRNSDVYSEEIANDYQTPIKVYIVENDSNLLAYLLPKVNYLDDDSKQK